MPPPFFELGVMVATKAEVPARICLRKGYRKIELPKGRYVVSEVQRNEDFWHVPEKSDGYTYRLWAVDQQNQYWRERISIWQNDLADAVYGEEADNRSAPAQ